jgi:hypothetical protein
MPLESLGESHSRHSRLLARSVSRIQVIRLTLSLVSFLGTLWEACTVLYTQVMRSMS